MAGTDPPANDLLGRLLLSADGLAIGLITDVLIDTATRTRVASVELGSEEGVQLIPLLETDRRAGEVTIEFEAELVRSAPVVTQQLDYRTLPEALERARAHFGVPVWADSTEPPAEIGGPGAELPSTGNLLGPGRPGPETGGVLGTPSGARAGGSGRTAALGGGGPAGGAGGGRSSGPATSEDDDPPWLANDDSTWPAEN